jgi:hypothetical protein
MAFLMLLPLAACKKSNDLLNCESQETTSFFFKQNQQVDTTHQVTSGSGAFFATSISGPDLVFHYTHSTMACADVIDGGYTDDLIFQVPAGSTSFDYDDSTKLANANTYFVKKCYCNNVTARRVTGRIKGSKINATSWSVQVDVADTQNPQYRIISNRTVTLQ